MDIYIGAYLEIEAGQVERPGPKQCPEGHQAADHWNVCPFCGGALTRKPIMFTVGLLDLLGDRADLRELNLGGSKILAVGNLNKPLPDHVKDTTAPFVVNISQKTESAYWTNFQTNYRDIIAELREKANVTVKFGVVGYDW